MNRLKIFISLLVILITCTAFSQGLSVDSIRNDNKLLKSSLLYCDSVNNIQSLQIHNFIYVIKKNQNEIINLQVENERLKNKIILHNEKLKQSQEKYKIILTKN